MVNLGFDPQAGHLQGRELAAAKGPRYVPVALFQLVRGLALEADAAAGSAGGPGRRTHDDAIEGAVRAQPGIAHSGRFGRAPVGPDPRNGWIPFSLFPRKHAGTGALLEKERLHSLRRLKAKLRLGDRGVGLDLDRAGNVLRQSGQDLLAAA